MSDANITHGLHDIRTEVGFILKQMDIYLLCNQGNSFGYPLVMMNQVFSGFVSHTQKPDQDIVLRRAIATGLVPPNPPRFQRTSILRPNVILFVPREFKLRLLDAVAASGSLSAWAARAASSTTGGGFIHAIAGVSAMIGAVRVGVVHAIGRMPTFVGGIVRISVWILHTVARLCRMSIAVKIVFRAVAVFAHTG